MTTSNPTLFNKVTITLSREHILSLKYFLDRADLKAYEIPRFMDLNKAIGEGIASGTPTDEVVATPES